VVGNLLYRPLVFVFGCGVLSLVLMLNRVGEKFVGLMNVYLPSPDVNEYIVTRAVAECGSATVGTCALAILVSCQ
ncbi:fructokinase/branched chain amino acid--2-keto-4-methylthiobutyrate aminotransferase, partial [Streptococcus suis]